jgi:hypothetical protein
MSEEMKKGKITFNAKGLIEIADDSETDISQLNEDQRAIVRQLGETVNAYLTVAEELLNGKYAHLKNWTPIHLAEPGNVLVASCLDGVVIRYERRVDKKRGSCVASVP